MIPILCGHDLLRVHPLSILCPPSPSLLLLRPQWPLCWGSYSAGALSACRSLSFLIPLPGILPPTCHMLLPSSPTSLLQWLPERPSLTTLPNELPAGFLSPGSAHLSSDCVSPSGPPLHLMLLTCVLTHMSKGGWACFLHGYTPVIFVKWKGVRRRRVLADTEGSLWVSPRLAQPPSWRAHLCRGSVCHRHHRRPE